MANIKFVPALSANKSVATVISAEEAARDAAARDVAAKEKAQKLEERRLKDNIRNSLKASSAAQSKIDAVVAMFGKKGDYEVLVENLPDKRMTMDAYKASVMIRKAEADVWKAIGKANAAYLLANVRHDDSSLTDASHAIDEARAAFDALVDKLPITDTASSNHRVMGLKELEQAEAWRKGKNAVIAIHSAYTEGDWEKMHKLADDADNIANEMSAGGWAIVARQVRDYASRARAHTESDAPPAQVQAAQEPAQPSEPTPIVEDAVQAQIDKRDADIATATDAYEEAVQNRDQAEAEYHSVVEATEPAISAFEEANEARMQIVFTLRNDLNASPKDIAELQAKKDAAWTLLNSLREERDAGMEARLDAHTKWQDADTDVTRAESVKELATLRTIDGPAAAQADVIDVQPEQDTAAASAPSIEPDDQEARRAAVHADALAEWDAAESVARTHIADGDAFSRKVTRIDRQAAREETAEENIRLQAQAIESAAQAEDAANVAYQAATEGSAASRNEARAAAEEASQAAADARAAAEAAAQAWTEFYAADAANLAMASEMDDANYVYQDALKKRDKLGRRASDKARAKAQANVDAAQDALNSALEAWEPFRLARRAAEDKADAANKAAKDAQSAASNAAIKAVAAAKVAGAAAATEPEQELQALGQETAVALLATETAVAYEAEAIIKPPRRHRKADADDVVLTDKADADDVVLTDKSNVKAKAYVKDDTPVPTRRGGIPPGAGKAGKAQAAAKSSSPRKKAKGEHEMARVRRQVKSAQKKGVR